MCTHKARGTSRDLLTEMFSQAPLPTYPGDTAMSEAAPTGNSTLPFARGATD
jgi:hypothetical protein